MPDLAHGGSFMVAKKACGPLALAHEMVEEEVAQAPAREDF
jgi:hypothetical protein